MMSFQQLYIGFRNPIIDGKAVLVPLTNPKEVIRAGARAILGNPVQLDLGGLGFRSGKGTEAPVDLKVDLLDLNPEAALVFGDEKDGRILILSDDGKWKVGTNEDRKKTEDSKRQFRSAWLTVE
ncbi:MAG: hypothetical protein ABI162_17595 [Luteolibacter sp.]